MKPILGFKDKLYQITQLTKRNLLIFLKNPTSIFFSLITPVLILVIFIFLFDDNVLETAIQFIDIEVSVEEIKVISSGWMVSGIIGISVLTVGLNSMFIQIKDKEKHTINDYVASPVKLVYVTLSYFMSAFILTFMICLVFLTIGLVYLSVSTGVIFSFMTILELLLILLLSTLSGIIILMVITSFFKKTSTASSFTGVFSALIGFLIGAYLPIGLLPKGLQNMANLIPGSHSTGLFRNVIVNEMIEKLNLTNIEGLATLKQSFGIDLVLFNQPLTKGIMYGYLGISMIVFFIIYLAIEYVKTKQKWIKK